MTLKEHLLGVYVYVTLRSRDIPINDLQLVSLTQVSPEGHIYSPQGHFCCFRANLTPWFTYDPEAGVYRENGPRICDPKEQGHDPQGIALL